MKDMGIAVNIISNSWDDFIYDIEQMRVEIKSFKKVLDKYAYILFWEEGIPIHLREEYRAMIGEAAKRSGLTHLIDFLEIEKNVDGYDYKMELSKK